MKRAGVTALVAALTLSVSACSQTPSIDTEDAGWSVGCAALDAGLRVDGIKRDAQVRILNQVVDSSGLPSSQRAWARQGVSLLQYDDVRRAPASLRAAAGKPCRAHGHRVSALG